MVEHLKVQLTYWVGGLMVEPAYASSPYGRAPPDLNSRACLRILISRATKVPLIPVLLAFPLTFDWDLYWLAGEEIQ